MQSKISVIMPVYNVEAYVEKSVRSICEQTYKNFEFIIVDDGSKDNSIKIIKKILNEYSVNFKIVVQENKGLSGARNSGIRASEGDWIICIDSDDTIHPQTLEILSKYLLSDNNIDAYAFNFKKVSVPPNEFKKIKNVKYIEYTQHEFAQNFLLRKMQLAVTTLLIKKEIYEKCYYDEKCKFSEDQLFVWGLLPHIKKIKFIQEELYYYLIRKGSIMTSSNIDKILTGYNKFLELDRQFLRQNRYQFEYGINTELILPRWVFGVLHSSAKQMNYKDFKKLCDAINKNNIIYKLKDYPDKRIYFISLIEKLNKKLFFFVLNKI